MGDDAIDQGFSPNSTGARDPAICKALLQEAVQSLLRGDTGAGRAGMRDCISAMVGFEKLSGALGRPQKGSYAEARVVADAALAAKAKKPAHHRPAVICLRRSARYPS
jgi:hypothetical protein